MPEHTPAPTPARSLYGFFLYLFSKTMLFLYCAWVFIPDEYLHYINIYYYPQKYWATAVPIQCLVALTLFAFIIYPSSNLMLTVNMDSINTIKDSHSRYSVPTPKYTSHVSDKCICKDSNKCFMNEYKALPKNLAQNSVQPLQDLDIRLVCKKLYLNK